MYRFNVINRYAKIRIITDLAIIMAFERIPLKMTETMALFLTNSIINIKNYKLH